MLTRTRLPPFVLLPIEGALPIFPEGPEPDVLLWLAAFVMPVVAPTALGASDPGPVRGPVGGAGVTRDLAKVLMSTGVVL